MIRKWLLTVVASGVLAVSFVGCGEETPAPKKDEKAKTEAPATPKTETKAPAPTTETPATPKTE